MSSPAKLTDTQRAILFEASQRKDRCLIPPKTLKAAAAQKVATKLLRGALLSGVKMKHASNVLFRHRGGHDKAIEYRHWCSASPQSVQGN